jgi:predicted metalloprotease with PDZ domain
LFGVKSFDYQKPALTKELWIAEGITSFYDNYILFLSGITSITEYLNEIVSDIKNSILLIHRYKDHYEQLRLLHSCVLQ